MTPLFETFFVTIAAALWVVVSIGFAIAVFSPKIRDTTWERIALGCVSVTAAGNACRVLLLGWVNEGGLVHAAAMALLVVVLVRKHARNTPTPLPRDKTGPAPLGEIHELQ